MKELLVNFKQVYFNQSFSLMNRVDFKFLLTSSEAAYLLDNLNDQFDLISNNSQLVREYETRYFDTIQRDAFHQHHKGKLPRFKIRTRFYLDTKDQFLEIKYKNNKDKTEKYRIECSNSAALFKQKNVVSFLNEHNIENTELLEEALIVKYNRISLKHKSTNERITLDFDISFSNNQNNTTLGDIVIVEVKQETRSTSKALTMLKSIHKHAISMSKYCYGILSTGAIIKSNNFNPLLKKINKINTPI